MVGATRELSLRVSVAVLARVLFEHPKNGNLMLALERKATLLEKADDSHTEVMTQPFGGAVRISDLQTFHKKVGEFHFDSSRSRDEGDFRIFIKPSRWPFVREFCIEHLKDSHDQILENDPARELIEEFEDTLKIRLTNDQFKSEPEGIVVEETPLPTNNTRASGYPTVRVYHIYETLLTDPALAKEVILGSDRISDKELSELVRKDASSGGKGRANAILALPLKKVVDYYQSLPLKMRNKVIVIDDHQLSETTAAILDGVEVPKYKRI